MWVKVCEGKTGQRTGAVLLAVEEGRKLLCLGGLLGGEVPYVQVFDASEQSWSKFSAAQPAVKDGLHAYYKAAYDPKGRRVYCFSDGPVYVFDPEAKAWKTLPAPEVLTGVTWQAAAVDPESRRLVVIGADKQAGNIGWTATAILDLDSGKWSRLPPPAEATVKKHKELLAAREAVIELVGRTRLAWYRDPQGTGTAEERKGLVDRCAGLKELAGLSPFVTAVEEVAGFLKSAKTLEALQAARQLQRKLELETERLYPVPPARRNSPLVFDAASKLFVLFGGDHEDYLANDTWVLDLAGGTWRRSRAALAPSPRAGHALVCLPRAGKMALYGGYVQSNSPWYGARPWEPTEPRQLWLYDAKADRWDLLGAWRGGRGEGSNPNASRPGTFEQSVPPATEGFYGYSAQFYSPPALAADVEGRLVLAVPGEKQRPSSTWLLKVDASSPDPQRRERFGSAPDQRLYRTGRFLASYCEVPDPPKAPDLTKLPANQWVQLAPAPRNVAYGCRQRDWGTAVWDAANQQILLWGGGHCVRSASCVLHYSPASGRIVEGYDADEPYSANGSGGFGSSVLNRPWVGVHGYNSYAYDPPSGLMVTATGYLYDPARMDWLGEAPSGEAPPGSESPLGSFPMQRPFEYRWSSTVLEATPRGAVAWAHHGDRVSLWLFEYPKGWSDLKPKGSLYSPYCDSEGMTYDTKRDRMILGWGGGYEKCGDGTLTVFDFKTRALEKLTPGNLGLGRIHNTREMIYDERADWVVFAEPYSPEPKSASAAKTYLRIYDCARNKYFLLDAGSGPSAAVHSQGWCYDGEVSKRGGPRSVASRLAERGIIYVITYRGEAYALKLDPKSAKLLDGP